MSKFENTNVNIHGDGNHVGDKVNITNKVTNNHLHVTNMNRASPSDSGGSGGAVAVAVALGIFAAWQFVRHVEQVVSTMQYAIALATVPSLVAAVIAYNRDKDSQPIALSAIPSAICALAAYLLIGLIGDNIPKEIEQLAVNRSIIQFWQGLNNYGHQLVMQSTAATVFVLLGTLSNIFAGLRTFATTNYSWFAWLWRLTWRNSPWRHIGTQILCLGTAALIATGKAVLIWAWFQDVIRTALS